MGDAVEWTLFDDERCAARSIDVGAFDTATEHRLDEHSSITHVHGLIRGHQALMDQLSALSGTNRSLIMLHPPAIP
jgi:hypothetical protein